MPTFHLIAAPWFIEIFATDRDTTGWEEIAYHWAIAAIVIAFSCAVGMMLIKWWRKEFAAGVPKKLTWTRKKALFFILAGLAPIALFSIAYFWLVRDFQTIIGIKGLVLEIFFSGILYFILAVIGHLMFPWRREIF